jgi:hypothetical protein
MKTNAITKVDYFKVLDRLPSILIMFVLLQSWIDCLLSYLHSEYFMIVKTDAVKQFFLVTIKAVLPILVN